MQDECVTGCDTYSEGQARWVHLDLAFWHNLASYFVTFNVTFIEKKTYSEGRTICQSYVGM